jgi:hypothetical protein
MPRSEIPYVSDQWLALSSTINFEKLWAITVRDKKPFHGSDRSILGKVQIHAFNNGTVLSIQRLVSTYTK